MAQDVNEVLVSKWQERLKRQSESGLTIEAFCRSEGISETVFYAWKRKLRGSVSARTGLRAAKPGRRSAKPRIAGRKRRKSQTVLAGDAAPSAAREFLQLPVRRAPSIPWIELSLVDGTVVRIPQENHAALTLVLQTLRPESSGLLAEAQHA